MPQRKLWKKYYFYFPVTDDLFMNICIIKAKLMGYTNIGIDNMVPYLSIKSLTCYSADFFINWNQLDLNSNATILMHLNISPNELSFSYSIHVSIRRQSSGPLPWPGAPFTYMDYL